MSYIRSIKYEIRNRNYLVNFLRQKIDFNNNLSRLPLISQITFIMHLAVMVHLMRHQMYPSLSPRITYKSDPVEIHQTQCQTALKQFQEICSQRGSNTFTLEPKTTSFIYRPRTPGNLKLDLREFNQVLSINLTTLEAHVQGSCTFYDLVTKCIPLKLLPKVPPELRGITVAGAYVGIGIESRSWLEGLFHHTVNELEVLTSNGEILTCNAKLNSDLFHGMVNSYGTLGYILSMKIQLMLIKPYVDVTYVHFTDVKEFFQKIHEICKIESQLDFIDGMLVNPNHQILITGKMSSVPNHVLAPNYITDEIYHKSILNKTSESFEISDYVWRWDRDSFWSTTGTILENSLVRKILGPHLLRTDRLIRFRKWFELSPNTEELIQDVGIPIDRCSEFHQWYSTNINIYPVFICPVKPDDGSTPLWNPPKDKLYCDFGFFGQKQSMHSDPAYYNKLVEQCVTEIGGIKSLYSRTYYEKETFEKLYYGADSYTNLKAKYDTQQILPMLYDKVCKNSL